MIFIFQERIAKRRKKDHVQPVPKNYPHSTSSKNENPVGNAGNNVASQPTPKRTSRLKRKTVTPPSLPSQPKPFSNELSAKELRRIKFLIEQSVTPQGVSKKHFTTPMSRSEEIYTSIEKLVQRGAELRRKASSICVDEEWFHPDMQKLIKLQVCVILILYVLV